MDSTEPYYRFIESSIEEARTDTPVIMIIGPRQAGKTTLAKQLTNKGIQYITLDDETTRLAAQRDPAGLIRSLDKVAIDEIQRVPQLLLAIKKSVDDDRRPGRFLLTGSANLMALPTVADSLAGRMETLSLFPLAQAEIERHPTNWLDAAFSGRLLKLSKKSITKTLIDRVLMGGYPEMLKRPSPRRRATWAKQYIAAIVERDVRDIADIEKLDRLPRFLQILAQTAGQMCNYTHLGAQIGLDGKTAAKYIGVLENMFLLRRVQVWTSNKIKRIVKTPKLQFLDSGLLTTLLNLDAKAIQRDHTKFGSLLETFVFTELLKHATWSHNTYQFLYYRDADKFEVDFILENTEGLLMGIEVKAAASINSEDLRGLKKLAGLAKKKFFRGIIFYDGDETLPLGDNIWATPVAGLWAGEG